MLLLYVLRRALRRLQVNRLLPDGCKPIESHVPAQPHQPVSLLHTSSLQSMRKFILRFKPRKPPRPKYKLKRTRFNRKKIRQPDERYYYLSKNVRGLGKAGKRISVKRSYARRYLISRQLAVPVKEYVRRRKHLRFLRRKYGLPRIINPMKHREMTVLPYVRPPSVPKSNIVTIYKPGSVARIDLIQKIDQAEGLKLLLDRVRSVTKYDIINMLKTNLELRLATKYIGDTSGINSLGPHEVQLHVMPNVWRTLRFEVAIDPSARSKKKSNTKEQEEHKLQKLVTAAAESVQGLPEQESTPVVADSCHQTGIIDGDEGVSR